MVCEQMIESKIIKKQACFLPGSPDSSPLIGLIKGSKNTYISTGKQNIKKIENN